MNFLDRLAAGVSSDLKDQPTSLQSDSFLNEQDSHQEIFDRPLSYANVQASEESIKQNHFAKTGAQSSENFSLSFHPDDIDETIIVGIPDEVGSAEIAHDDISPLVSEIREPGCSDEHPMDHDEIVARAQLMLAKADAHTVSHREDTLDTKEYVVHNEDTQRNKAAERDIEPNTTEQHKEKENQELQPVSRKVTHGHLKGTYYTAISIFLLVTGVLTLVSFSFYSGMIGETADEIPFPSQDVVLDPDVANIIVTSSRENVSKDNRSTFETASFTSIAVTSIIDSNSTWSNNLSRNCKTQDDRPTIQTASSGTSLVVMCLTSSSDDSEFSWIFGSFQNARWLLCAIMAISSAAMLKAGLQLEYFRPNSSSSGSPQNPSKDIDSVPVKEHHGNCGCSKTLTKFENLMKFQNSFQSSGKGRKTFPLSEDKFPESYQKLTMDELKTLITGLDPNIAGPKELYSWPKNVRVAKLYDSYTTVLKSFTKSQLTALLACKQISLKKTASKGELVAAGLEVGF
mmetsp:Transcript_15599/g.20326  ORF Transcript_15599/g.20326 Transcript_15599/m.20326 type:complete len:514 (-) Transcript_15599:119-1660(-)|eukprot:CAMPEP_0198149000 /NCGR_PEP_ID=MMETSP1443-20131203/44545_1 /TAXON_ID=186043 /ORGANISM="Entomoneis sp., Strain CCMP2396" /LENGTH=513 /DNA_ID=CAMNT_0043813887 /DNA_START=190 /DNA_END=1731 /DNA_ORIENTATION=-